MWVDTYPYVRLHQPHPMFTAGNIAGTIGRRPSYLPTKGEVLEHFSHCLDEIGKRLTIDERYGWDLTSDEPSADGNVMDFDRWYPWPRRATGSVRFVLTHRREREHLRRTLDAVRQRCDVRCGPLAFGATAFEAAAG